MSFAYRVYRSGKVCAVGAGYATRDEAETEARPLLREPGDYADITENSGWAITVHPIDDRRTPRTFPDIQIIGRIDYGTDRQ
jgi:hypothetical protein